MHYIVYVDHAGIDVKPKWNHYRDGSYCDPEGGKTRLSKDISSGAQCMSLGDASSKRYVSFMMIPDSNNGDRYCYGYDYCEKETNNTNYKTYVMRSDTGTLQEYLSRAFIIIMLTSFYKKLCIFLYICSFKSR